jgi:hypothetical protein
VTTAQEWVRRFGLIHKHFGKLPADFQSMGANEAGNFIQDIVARLEIEEKTGDFSEQWQLLIFSSDAHDFQKSFVKLLS